MHRRTTSRSQAGRGWQAPACANEPIRFRQCVTLRFQAHLLRQTGERTVSENVLEPGPQDYDRINVLVEAELVYWTQQFGVSRQQLAQAIQDVGPRIPDLRKVLGEPAP